jgi:pyruvyltransferase
LKGTTEAEIALGDPAILLPLIWESSGGKQSQVAVVPHFATYDLFLSRYKGVLPKTWQVVDLLNSPETICRQIDGAEFVISSSLHGLIAADGYGVPSCWMEPHATIRGDGFKFADYFSFRGAPLPGPVDFEDFLKRSDEHMSDDRCRPVVPSAQNVSELLAAFPFSGLR